MTNKDAISLIKTIADASMNADRIGLFEPKPITTALYMAIDALSIDAEPVRHGHWIEKELFIPWCDDDVDIIYECSCCGTGVGPSPYCPNCGAKMDNGG